MDSPETNWLIVGLGNPGLEYERTRHNVGFMLADLLAGQCQTQIRRDECRALIGRAEIAGQMAELAKPQTYMNLSGEAVSCLVAKPSRAIEKLIVISDDLAIPFGTIRIRPKGSHGGQNGLRSIIDRLKTQEFIRLRVGIQPDHEIRDAANFVLDKFTKAESATLGKVLDDAADAIRTIISEGVEAAMSRFN
ncbi:MAG: aminoacyl-tRNA hydrolase [Acidobacteriota bacterium]